MCKKLLTRLLLIFLIAVLGGCGGSKNASDTKVLNIYSWADYYSPEVLA